MMQIKETHVVMTGDLKLKRDDGGWRHYIELPDGSHDDINCGSMLEVQLGRYKDDDEFHPGEWLSGRYEADLCSDNPKARLVLGYFYSNGDEAAIKLPVGVRVRR